MLRAPSHGRPPRATGTRGWGTRPFAGGGHAGVHPGFDTSQARTCPGTARDAGWARKPAGCGESKRIAQPSRILFFDAYPHVYAGAQRVTQLLAIGLAGRGHATAVLTTAEGAFTEQLRAGGVEVAVVEAPPALSHYGRTTIGGRAVGAALALPRYGARLRTAIRTWRPDVVHLDDHRGILLAGLPAKLAGAKVTWHVHALEDRPRLTRLGTALADAVVVPSAAVTERMPALAARGAPVVVPNPAPCATIEATSPPSDPRLVTLARLHPDKGLDVLLHALRELHDHLPDVTLTVAGAPQAGYERYPEELRAIVARLGLGAHVCLAGHTPDPVALLASARAYVQPSRERTEILPLAILEAMAVGRPVVATAVGGVADLVRPGETGELVPPGDPHALAQALLHVLGDAGVVDRYGKAGRDRVESHFSETGFLDTIEAVHAAVVTS